MSRTLISITCIVYILAIIGALFAGQDKPVNNEVKPDNTKKKSVEYRYPHQHDKQMIGMSLNVYYTDQLERYLAAIDRIHQAWFNTIQVITPVFQTNSSSQKIVFPVTEGRSPSANQLIKLLNHAHNLGMRTVLMPQVNFTNPRGNEWRGKINPHNWSAWWNSYNQMIDKYLTIAKRGHADVFIIGCELVSTLNSEHLKQWKQVIDYCRDNFDGKLTFSTTWDTYGRILFWDKLDFIGISGYWDLTKGAANKKQPTNTELANRWSDIKKPLLEFSKANHKPILITEIGYPALPWGLSKPWNYINDDNVKPAPKVQTRGYKSFLRNWSANLTPPSHPYKKHPHVAGAIFYKWDVNISNLVKDTGYSIQGKPAFNIVKKWLNGEKLTESNNTINESNK